MPTAPDILPQQELFLDARTTRQQLEQYQISYDELAPHLPIVRSKNGIISHPQHYVLALANITLKITDTQMRRQQLATYAESPDAHMIIDTVRKAERARFGGKSFGRNASKNLLSWQFPPNYNPNRYTVLGKHAVGELTDAYAPKFRGKTEQVRSVSAMHFHEGAFRVNISKEVISDWDNPLYLDSLALRAIGLHDVECDSILTNKPIDSATGTVTKARIKKLQAKFGGLSLPGIIRLSFETGAFVITKTDETIANVLNDGEKENILLASQGLSREDAYRASTTTNSLKMFSRQRSTAFEFLDVETIQSATTRLILARLIHN